MGRKSKNSFVIQGSILAFAGILVRIIGLIYRIPLTRILGDEGNGYLPSSVRRGNGGGTASGDHPPPPVCKLFRHQPG